MALTFTELEAITRDYFLADGKAAVDIYFNDSFLMDYLMNKQKGLWKRPSGGKRIRQGLMYDGQNSGSFDRTSTLSSDDRESINAAFFYWKHYYSNASVYLLDELENADEYAEVELVAGRIEGAQQSIRKDIATDIYSASTDTATGLTGLRSLTSETTSVAYGGIAEDDLVASDGTKPWEGKTESTAAAITLNVVRTRRSDAKVSSGQGGRPNIATTTETLFNSLAAQLQVQQRFKEDSSTAKAGFTHLEFEGTIIAADDSCPSGYMFCLNSRFVGLAVHKKGYFVRDPWANLIVTGKPAKSMKIFWHGNVICSNRKAHKAQSGLTA